MRFSILALGCASLLAGQPVSAAETPECLSAAELQEAVSERRVVAPTDAMASAREAVRGGEVLRASLCRDGDTVIYMLVVLAGDGRLVRVTIDAASGKVAALR